jgi:hypothetical protein
VRTSPPRSSWSSALPAETQNPLHNIGTLKSLQRRPGSHRHIQLSQFSPSPTTRPTHRLLAAAEPSQTLPGSRSRRPAVRCGPPGSQRIGATRPDGDGPRRAPWRHPYRRRRAVGAWTGRRWPRRARVQYDYVGCGPRRIASPSPRGDAGRPAGPVDFRCRTACTHCYQPTPTTTAGDSVELWFGLGAPGGQRYLKPVALTIGSRIATCRAVGQVPC